MSRIVEAAEVLLRDAPDVPIRVELLALTNVEPTHLIYLHLANQAAKGLVYRHAKPVVKALVNTEADKNYSAGLGTAKPAFLNLSK